MVECNRAFVALDSSDIVLKTICGVRNVGTIIILHNKFNVGYQEHSRSAWPVERGHAQTREAKKVDSEERKSVEQAQKCNVSTEIYTEKVLQNVGEGEK